MKKEELSFLLSKVIEDKINKPINGTLRTASR